MEDRLHAALAVLRVVVTLNMIGMAVWGWSAFRHEWAGVLTVVALVAWTVLVLVLYRSPARRRPGLFVLDLAVAVVAMAVSPVIKGEDLSATIPGFWVMGPLLVWAVHWHWRGGLVAGALLAGVDVAIRTEITQGNYGNVFLLVVGGAVLGYMCGSLVQMAEERSEAERLAAVAQERTRLARAVHDGVLQVLALVQRRGAELGARSAEFSDFSDLGRLAGEQEDVLRSLIRAQDTVTVDSGTFTPLRAPSLHPIGRAGTVSAVHDSSGLRDLTGQLECLASPLVTVVTPGESVLVPAHRADELVAAVKACLDNVRMHVGLDAPAWVLVEDVGDRVVVSVRDEGPGIAAGRLEEAEQQGRLGVRSSIRDRVAEIGGTATLTSGRWGTEWEFELPR